MFSDGSYHNATSEKKVFLKVSKHSSECRSSNPNLGQRFDDIAHGHFSLISYIIYIYNICSLYMGTTGNTCYPRFFTLFSCAVTQIPGCAEVLERLSKPPVLARLLQTGCREGCRHLVSILS